jgi:hypothetical protein
VFLVANNFPKLTHTSEHSARENAEPKREKVKEDGENCTPVISKFRVYTLHQILL